MTIDWVGKGEKIDKFLGQGTRFPGEIGLLLERILGQEVGQEGLAQIFQPRFSGVKTFLVQSRLTTNRFVELLVVGVARDGRPIWTAERSLGYGRDGSVEIHHGQDQVIPEFRSQNILVDCLDNELKLLKTLDVGPNARITFDAQGVGSYLGALHGFVFADDTEEGPPLQSYRALEPDGDRKRIIQGATARLKEYAERQKIKGPALNDALEQVNNVQSPHDLAQISMESHRFELPPHERSFAKSTGRALCLDEKMPSWRAALYPNNLVQAGDAFRTHHREESEKKRAEEIRACTQQLQNNQRSVQIKALRTLGRCAPNWLLPEIKALFNHEHRGVAVVARQVSRQINETDFHERISSFANNKKNSGNLRGHAYRVLAEYYPEAIASKVAILRVNPDAQIQRSIIPILRNSVNAGPQLASLLTANPRSHRDADRPGLDALRIELIECLSQIDDSRIVPSLMCALAAVPSPSPVEVLALSRALVSHPDPRARPALNMVAQRLDRPLVP